MIGLNLVSYGVKNKGDVEKKRKSGSNCSANPHLLRLHNFHNSEER